MFQGGFNVHVFLSTCFVLTLSCLRVGFCGGWVSDLLWWGVGRSTCGEGNFYGTCRPLICNFTENVSFLQVFFIHFAEADYLPGFCVDRCLGGYVYMSVYRCECMYVCLYICVCICICMYNICICICVCVCMYRYIYTQIFLLDLLYSICWLFVLLCLTIIQFVDAEQQVEMFISNWHKRTFCHSVRTHCIFVYI